MDGDALGNLLCCTRNGPSDGVAKAIASISGAGSVGEVNEDNPVFFSPRIHGHAVWLGIWCTWRCEHKFTGIEVLGDVDVVGCTFTRLDLLGAVIHGKHDVAR